MKWLVSWLNKVGKAGILQKLIHVGKRHRSYAMVCVSTVCYIVIWE